MTDYSEKVQVHKLEEVTVSGKPVYVRDLSVGDRCAIAPMLGDLTAAARSIKEAADEGEEDVREVAEQSLSSDQYKALIDYMTEHVFRVWSDAKGKRKYTDRKAFDELNPALIDAIYREAHAVNEVSVEDAEKN